MDVRIVKISDQGAYDKEYVWLKADQDCDLGDYILADSTYSAAGQPSNKARHVFFFPTREVKKGEFISLWTKPGKNVMGKSTEGDTVHRFFWGLKESIWNDTGDCAYLMKAPRSERKAYQVPKKS